MEPTTIKQVIKTVSVVLMIIVLEILAVIGLLLSIAGIFTGQFVDSFFTLLIVVGLGYLMWRLMKYLVVVVCKECDCEK
jgi:phosphotransferase system  glucose/maltose/N-acetylglucosamine-specific IIC component